MGDGRQVVFDRTRGLGAYKCRGCKGGGGNTGYKCRWYPKFMLHEICTAWRDEVRYHPFFPEDPFKFRSRTHLRHNCNACGVLIRGFLFQSRDGRTLHPLCFTLPGSLKHSGHEHANLQLIKKGEKHSCMFCRKESTNWRYRCTVLACPSTLDMSCAILDMDKLSKHGITQVYKRSKTQRALRMVARVGTVVSTPLLGAAGTAVIMA